MKADRLALGQFLIALRIRKRRHGQHDAGREAGLRCDLQTVWTQHAAKNRVPAFLVQRLANRKARIAEAAGEFQRPQPLVVDDHVQVDVAAVAAVPQQRRDLAERRIEQLFRIPVADDGPHLAGQLAEIARKKALVLEVDAGRRQKRLAVEIGADADLDALHMPHQHEVGRLAA